MDQIGQRRNEIQRGYTIYHPAIDICGRCGPFSRTMRRDRIGIVQNAFRQTELINPPELGGHPGYSNGVLAPAGARVLFVAGQIAWDSAHRLVGGGDFAAQFAQALANVLCVVRAAGGRPEHLTELTVFVTDKHAYMSRLADIGRAWRELCGRHYPAMALVEVKGLLEPGAMVEIRGAAAIPAGPGDAGNRLSAGRKASANGRAPRQRRSARQAKRRPTR